MLAVVLGMAVSPAAQAAPGDGVSCAGGTSSTSIKPGLTLIGDRLQSVHVTAQSTNCQGSDVLKADLSLDAQGNGGCIPTLGIPNASATARITWTTSEGVSTSDLSGTFQLGLGGWSADAVITSGQFKGRHLTVAGSHSQSEVINASNRCIAGKWDGSTATVEQLTVS
ncbi:hypothetical protein ACIG3E_22640 [Streptomyces sp. NPDC053474]|uniref:hypothetical protein n=1 Tax=Streptomyces sp. NPDC053474 TaxID=3365704 RepID=UPI0037D5CC78